MIARWKTQLGGKPVFVRSSSNTEDLPNFSGAGLYSSVRNVVEEDKLIEGVKKVWASLWNFQGYEARVRNYVSQSDVYMSALVQIGVDMEKRRRDDHQGPVRRPQQKCRLYQRRLRPQFKGRRQRSVYPNRYLFNPKVQFGCCHDAFTAGKCALAFDENGDLKETVDKCAGAKKRVLTDLAGSKSGKGGDQYSNRVWRQEGTGHRMGYNERANLRRSVTALYRQEITI